MRIPLIWVVAKVPGCQPWRSNAKAGMPQLSRMLLPGCLWSSRPGLCQSSPCRVLWGIYGHGFTAEAIICNCGIDRLPRYVFPGMAAELLLDSCVQLCLSLGCGRQAPTCWIFGGQVCLQVNSLHTHLFQHLLHFFHGFVHVSWRRLFFSCWRSKGACTAAAGH